MFFRTTLSAAAALLVSSATSLPVELSVGPITARAIEGRSESGPEIGGANFPDPSIIKSGNTWYSFATRTIGSSIHVQVATSPDFNTWSIVNAYDGSQLDAMPNLPPWMYAPSSNTWAPDVNLRSDGTYILYFSGSTNSDPSKHCVGAATSSSILGPYEAQPDPLYCPLSQGGAIDASGYNDGGTRYVVYKIDGNSNGHGGTCGNTVAPIQDTPLILQPVAEDGFTSTGASTTLLHLNDSTDSGVIEAPALAKYGNTYVLFFSSGCFMTDSYTVNYATAPAITGPYIRAASPLFQTGTDGLQAPGGMDVDVDNTHMVFHANYGSNTRPLFTAQISFNDNVISA